MMRRRGGIVRTMGRTAVIAGTASAVSGGVHRRQQQRWASKEQAAMAEQQAVYEQGVADAQASAPPPPPAPAAAPTADTIEQLKQLAELKQQGILSDAEFEAAKAKVLAG